MTHPDAETLIQSFRTTQWIVERQTEGLSHDDSVRQLPFRGNCLNWVLGHIANGRNTALKLLGALPIWDEATVALYQTGSEPIMGDGQELRLEQLLADLEQAAMRIKTALARISPQDLAALVEFRGSERSLGKTLDGLHWHETYHCGQLELLRQLAGKDDAII